MLTQRQIDTQIDYWFINAHAKLQTAKTLYTQGHYADCLFFCHLMVEMVLKALIVQKKKQHVPRTHHLPYLASISGIQLSKNN